MAGFDLLSVCALTYLTVFLVLGLLAVVIRLITVVFPGRPEVVDAAVVVAVTGCVAAMFPRAQVTRIEEEP